MVAVRHDQKSFQLLEHPIPPPLFGELHGSAHQISIAIGKFSFKLIKKSKCIRYRTGKSGNDLSMIQAAHLPRRILHHHGAAHRDLPVTGHSRMSVFLYSQYYTPR